MLFRSLSLGSWMVGLVMALSGHAETVQTCSFKGQIVLNESTQILCIGDLKVDGRARILTQGFSLTIITSGNADFAKGLDIVAYDSSLNNGGDGGSILISATTASGYLRIDNQGFTSANAPGGRSGTSATRSSGRRPSRRAGSASRRACGPSPSGASRAAPTHP